MRQSLTVSLPADDTDVLQTAGSNMRRAPEAGFYRIWARSDQNDGQLSIQSGGTAVVEDSEMPVGTVSVLNKDGPPTYEWSVSKGEEQVIAYNEVTGGTAILLIEFIGLFEYLVEKGMGPISAAKQAAAFA